MNYTFAIISLVGFLALFGLAGFVLARNPKEKLNQAFFACTNMVGLFLLFHALMITAGSPARSELFLDISIVFWFLFIAFYTHFSLVLAKKDDGPAGRIIIPVVYLASSVLALVDVLGGEYYVPPALTYWGYLSGSGKLFWLIALYTLSLIALQFWLLRQSYHKASNDREKKYNRIVFIAFCCAAAIIISFDVILPLFGFYVRSSLPVAVLVYLIILSYAMLKYGFLLVTPAMLARAVIDTMPDLMVFTDEAGRIKIINRKTIALLGFSEEEIINKRSDLFYLDRDEYYRITAAITEKGVAEEQTATLVKKNGTAVPVILDGVLIKDDYGQRLGNLYVYRDVSQEERLLIEQKKTIAELTKTKEEMLGLLNETRKKSAEIRQLYVELKGVDKMKTEFLSVISHELRTPLTPIKGYLDLLLTSKLGELSDQQRVVLVTMQSQSEHLLKTIDSILDVSRMEYGKVVEIEKSPLLINQTIRKVAEGMMGLFNDKRIELELELPETVPTMLGDETKIDRVLTNILGNALTFTPAGGRVVIKTLGEEGGVRVEIADDGIGLARENLEKIFEKFYQVDNSYTRKVGGIGIGLTLAQEIVNAHGGKIWAESDGLGRGARIIFTLPIGQ